MPYKSFSDGNTLTASEINTFLQQGVLVFDDASARDSALGSAAAGQIAYLKDTNQVLIYDGSAWIEPLDQNATVSGGTATTYSSGGTDYSVHTFTSTGTLTCTAAGYGDILLIGSGGKGLSGSTGTGATANCAGGGGGFVEISNVWIPEGSHTVTVGSATTAVTSLQEHTQFLDITAMQGGNGAFRNFSSSHGGSGGGAFRNDWSHSVTGQGNDGFGDTSSTNCGGGGAGAAATGDAGGAGASSSITGSAVTYSAGGTGSSSSAGAANTGNGGGGVNGNGGSGIAIIRVVV